MSDTASTSDTAQTSQDTREVVRERTSGEDRLTVYRDGDSYIAEYDGITIRETSWTKTHPVNLTPDQVERGDKLWAIPENWERAGAIQNPTICGAHVLYNFSRNSSRVLVQAPGRRHPMDAYYRVVSVGVSQFESRHLPDREALEKVVENPPEQLRADIQKGCQLLLDNWTDFHMSRHEGLLDVAPEVLACTPDSGHLGPEFDVKLENSWTSHCVQYATGLDRKTADELTELLHEYDVIERSPTVRVKLTDPQLLE